MSQVFVSASSHRAWIQANTPAFVVPFTVACWVKPTLVSGVKTMWSWGDTGTATHYWALTQNAGTAFRIDCRAGGTLVSGSTGVPVANRWYFIVVRCISATNRRISVWCNAAGAAHIQEATSRSPAGADFFAVGALSTSTQIQFWDGMMGEFWFTLTDIQPDGLQLQIAMLKQLAYYGPFSVPRIAKDILSYSSWRGGMGVSTDAVDRGYNYTKQIYFNPRVLPPVWHWPNNYPDFVGDDPPLNRLYVSPRPVMHRQNMLLV